MYTRKDAHEPASRSTTPKRTAQTGSTGARSRSVAPAPQPETLDFLDKLPGVLKPGGRAAILTFHSGEDRLVKKAFKQGLREGIYSDVAQDVIRPSAEECFRNPRAKSTKMRWAIRSEL